MEGESGTTDYPGLIRREADNEVGVYLDALGAKYRTLETKQMIESIVATDYDGRTLIELLQNATMHIPPEPGMVGSSCNLISEPVNMARST